MRMISTLVLLLLCFNALNLCNKENKVNQPVENSNPPELCLDHSTTCIYGKYDVAQLEDGRNSNPDPVA